MRCRRLRAIYAIMGCYKRYKVKAHFWEVERRFANVRNMADYGRGVEWPRPPAALSQFHSSTVTLHRRSDTDICHPAAVCGRKHPAITPYFLFSGGGRDRSSKTSLPPTCWRFGLKWRL